jgi:hypothetical protein
MSARVLGDISQVEVYAGVGATALIGDENLRR